MSAPAAKARSEPVSTMAEMLGEASNLARASFNSVIKGVQRALSALGRASVTARVSKGNWRVVDLKNSRRVGGKLTLPNSRSRLTRFNVFVGTYSRC